MRDLKSEWDYFCKLFKSSEDTEAMFGDFNGYKKIRENWTFLEVKEEINNLPL